MSEHEETFFESRSKEIGRLNGLVAELRAKLNGIEQRDKECSVIRVENCYIPERGRLVEAYMTDTEVIVCGVPAEEGSDHNCDAMGCSSLSHVIYRAPFFTHPKAITP